jgi:hypothetical protein|eukprot:g2858.t1
MSCRFPLLLLAVAVTIASASNPANSVVPLFSNVLSAKDYRYDLKDSAGLQMSCIHVDAIRGDTALWGGDKYLGLYHTMVGKQFNVRLASSKDLMTWTFRRTIVENGDMPFLKRVDGEDKDGWLLLTHEQWMNPNSQLPSRLGFKLFYNESELLMGNHFNSFVAPLSVGSYSRLEGTPSVYGAERANKQGLYVVNADIGFHFNDEKGKDTVAIGRLEQFGPTTIRPKLTGQHRADAYDELFIAKGAIGNIGQRAPGTVHGVHINAQEANIGSMPPTIWADWRIWLYFFAPSEGDVPTGAPGSHVEMLNVTTHGGSTAIGNPSWHLLPCPGEGAEDNCIFVSYFVFGEGAAPGEAGVLAFWKGL